MHMARKVFISFLGTNNYVECCYNINGSISKPVKFVQEAIVSKICKEWTKEDRIYIFCTSKAKTGQVGSKEINWEDTSNTVGLCSRLSDLNLKVGIEEIDIDTGFTEEEIWEVFDTVYSKLNRSDEIYFDVTHAFRSIPLFAIVLFNYSKFMINTRVATVMYGAFEKLGPIKSVLEMSIEKRIAPIVDMTNIIRLQEYNQTASGLQDFGKVKRISSGIESVKSKQDSVTELSNAIKRLEEYIATIQLDNIREGCYIRDFRVNLEKVRAEHSLPTPITKILDKLEKELESFRSYESFANVEAAINMAIEHEMLMQAYSLTEEYIIKCVAEKYDDQLPSDWEWSDCNDFIRALLGISNNKFTRKQWDYGILADNYIVSNAMASKIFIIKLRPAYNDLRERRNSLIHADEKYDYKRLCGEFQDIFDNCVNIIHEYITIE